MNTGRRIGAPLIVGGTDVYPNGRHVESLAFSPDGSQLAVSSVPDNDIASTGGIATLTVQMVDAATARTGVLIDAHVGNYSYYLAPFRDTLVFSADGRRISSVASRERRARSSARPKTVRS